MDSAIANTQRIEHLPCIAHKPENLETLFDASSFRERLLQEISQAKHRIYLVALYLQDDDAGRKILTALFEANNKIQILILKFWLIGIVHNED